MKEYALGRQKRRRLALAQMLNVPRTKRKREGRALLQQSLHGSKRTRTWPVGTNGRLKSFSRHKITDREKPIRASPALRRTGTALGALFEERRDNGELEGIRKLLV